MDRDLFREKLIEIVKRMVEHRPDKIPALVFNEMTRDPVKFADDIIAGERSLPIVLRDYALWEKKKDGWVKVKSVRLQYVTCVGQRPLKGR